LLDGPLFTLQSMSFPAYRGFMMAVSVAMLIMIWLLIARTRVGLVIQAALTHPDAVEALGHNVPRVFMLVFAGGAALAGLAGALGGPAFTTEPGMAGFVGTIIFVVVIVGGLGSLMGTFIASLIIGVVQTLAVSIDLTLASITGLTVMDIALPEPLQAIASLKVSQIAPSLPYLLMILVLIFRPRGLMGTRES
jgi:branched-chain amino acid transport system permease protein